MRTLILILISGITLFFACTNTTENKTTGANSVLPHGTVSTNVNISNLNCWVEEGQFFVIGICNNDAHEWQKIWLAMTPLDAEGRPMKVNGDSSGVFVTFSDAVPPRGRTSFFASWPLSAFPAPPDSCIVKGAAALPLTAGPILIAREQSGVKMLVPEKPGDTTQLERAWLVNVVVENPLDMMSAHPKVEMLLYGNDNRLWFASVLDPEDEQQKQYVKAERNGPMEPKERRRIGTNVYYDDLPKALKEQKIGRVEFLAFEARK